MSFTVKSKEMAGILLRKVMTNTKTIEKWLSHLDEDWSENRYAAGWDVLQVVTTRKTPALQINVTDQKRGANVKRMYDTDEGLVTEDDLEWAISFGEGVKDRIAEESLRIRAGYGFGCHGDPIIVVQGSRGDGRAMVVKSGVSRRVM